MEEKHADAANLLLVIGLLDVQSIPDVFFERNELNEQIPCLVDYGLVEPSADKRVLTMTAIIRQCVQVWLENMKERDQVEEKVLSILCTKFNERDYHTNEVLLPCALATPKFQVVSTESKSYLATLLYRVAQYYTHVGEHSVALEHLKRCLSLRKEDPEAKEDLIKETIQATEQVKSKLAASREESKALVETKTVTGRISQAQNQLQDLQRSMGQDHPETVRKASDFATFQLQHGDSSSSKDTIALYQRVLDWSKEKSGEESIDTARRQYNLALAHDQRGEYDDAASLYKSAFRTAEQQLGPGNPELLRILGNLACMYCAQGRLEDAQQAFGVVLAGQTTALGADHPETLVSRQNIAMMLGDLGQADEAGVELEKVLAVQARLLGLNNPATLRTACSLAVSYRMRGALEDAENMLKATLKIQEKILGKTHRDTKMTKLMLGELLQEMGKPKM
jgi:tetratricopeptide (TPR) repeat protein